MYLNRTLPFASPLCDFLSSSMFLHAPVGGAATRRTKSSNLAKHARHEMTIILPPEQVICSLSNRRLLPGERRCNGNMETPSTAGRALGRSQQCLPVASSRAERHD